MHSLRALVPPVPAQIVAVEVVAAPAPLVLEPVTAHSQLKELLSTIVPAESWEQLMAAQRESRAHNAEGLMLKRLDSPYGVGRQVGNWWKWKVEPYSAEDVIANYPGGAAGTASVSKKVA